MHVNWGWVTPDKIIAFATIVYALVTVVMFFAIRSQAGAAHRQADIAEITAKAAKQSADALVSSERAWVMAELGWYKENPLPVVEGTTESQALGKVETTTANVKLTCKNEGKSPAWIDNVYGHAEIVAKASLANANRKSDGQNFGPMGPLGASREESRCLQLTCPGHRKAGEFISVYVVVDYRDAFGLKRDTSVVSGT